MVGGGYYESLKNVEKFDYIIATHVIEHIPQFILFFQDISNILKPNGKLCLTIPDKRYCFDHYRCPTSFAECYDVYIRGTKNLPFRVLDCLISATKNDAAYWWKEQNNFKSLPYNEKEFNMAKKHYHQALDGEYKDVHYSVFTPETFLLLLYNMLMFNLLPFRIIEFEKTNLNTLEFDCILEVEPNILIENSIERQNEIENLINLLGINADSRYFLEIIENITNELDKTKNELQSILASKSWKITMALRKIKNFLNKKQ